MSHLVCHMSKHLTELQAIAKQHGGILRAEDVVAFARDSSTALHSRFEWNNGKAAHEWRLHQARNLIRVSVTMLPNVETPYRAFVSLVPDRSEDGGGYRRTVDVLDNQSSRQQLLSQALDELERMQEKYSQLTELASVFAAARAVRAKKKRA